MEAMDKQLLVRKRRDFFDASKACEDKWGDDKWKCLCEEGEEIWCDHEDNFNRVHSGISVTAVSTIVVIVILMICMCVFCICRRRRRGFVFRSPSGRTVTTTTAVVQLPSHSQTSGTTGGASYPTQQQWTPPQHGGFPQPPTGYQPPSAGYQPPAAGYQPPPAGYQPPPAGYQPPQGGYPQSGYPQAQGGYQPPQGGYPQAPAGYGPQQPVPFVPAAGGVADLPPPYDASVSRQPPFNPAFQEGGDSKRPL